MDSEKVEDAGGRELLHEAHSGPLSMRLLSGTFSRRHKWYIGALLGVLVVYLVFFVPLPNQLLSPEEVWTVVRRVAVVRGLEPAFVYAIIEAESSLNPDATTSSSRGLMQVSHGVWGLMTKKPFEDAYSWQTNIEIGTRYLDYCKRFLEDHRVFSYPRLAACYHMGPGALQACHWDVRCLPVPENLIYRALYSGNEKAVAVP